jgi:hypothetical protein
MHKSACAAVIPDLYDDTEDCMLDKNVKVADVEASGKATVDEGLMGVGNGNLTKSEYGSFAKSRRNLADVTLDSTFVFTVEAPAASTDAVTAVKGVSTKMVAAAAADPAAQKAAILANVEAVIEKVAIAEPGVTAADMNATMTAITTAIESATLVVAAPVEKGAATDAPATSGAYTYSLAGMAAVAVALLM